jgi:hypothetical protein
MGLERVAAVLQGKVSNFETDLFTPLIARAAELTGAANDVSIASLRIIADHARAATFLINDGVLPSNEGRGYVLRKILRRGIRHGRLLGQEQPFLFEMVYAVRDLMQGAYPELTDSAARVAKVVEAEEKQFDRVLKIGSTELQKEINEAIYLELKKYVEQWTDRMPNSQALRDALFKTSAEWNFEYLEQVIRHDLGETEGDKFARVLPTFKANSPPVPPIANCPRPASWATSSSPPPAPKSSPS